MNRFCVKFSPRSLLGIKELKFTVFHSFTIQYNLDIADPNSMQDASQI